MEETFTKAIDILKLAKKNNVEIVLNGDQLQLKVPKGSTINKNLFEELGANKELIINYLSNANLRLALIGNGSHNIISFDRDVVIRIPLSFSQERLWFIDRLEGSLQYHLPSVLRLKGMLDREALSRALAEIVNRHEILRTVYEEENGQVYQRIKAGGNWQLKQSDGRKYAGDEEDLERYIRNLTMEPFDLHKDDMLRAELIAIDPGDHILVITMHHIASDASSMPVLVREVAALYSSYVSGKEALLPLPLLQYADYAVWQREHVQGILLEEKLRYWKKKLESVTPLQLPADNERAAEGITRGSSVSFEIDAQLSQQVQSLGYHHGATLYMTLLAVFKVLLYRYSGQEDICVGTSVAGRPQRELEGLIGFFANTLALRDQVRGDMTFSTLLQDVKATTLEAYSHQEVPFEKVVEAVVKERQPGISPLFQVMLVLNNTSEAPKVKLGELTLSNQGFKQTISKFDLTFFIKETKGGFKGTVQYNTDLYSEARIKRMTSHFRELLLSVVNAPETAIGQLTLLGKAEKDALLVFGKSDSISPEQATLADMFEAQVQKHPEREAVVFAGERISYKTLNERANQLAYQLQRLGVKADTLVPLYTGRGIAMMTGILGILKAGGVYVPIDTAFPEDRISYMLDDTLASVAVSFGEYAGHLQSLSGGYMEIVDLDNLDYGTTIDNPARSLQPKHLAYVIYTSGSTGKPKGVEVSHGNVVDYVYGLDARTGISECKSFALVSTISTDLGNTVLYSSLLFGGTLHLFTKETVSHIEELHEYFKEHRIDCLKIVPSHWKALSPEGGEPLLPARMLIFGGETFPSESAARIKRYSEDCRVFNHYGPTETTIGKLVYELKEGYEGKVIPIGKPFSNTRTYVLSKELSLCPVGIPGQLYIAGAGLARGYLNQPGLTAEKFIQNPYDEDGGSRMYGTGDRVQYQEDGNIIFIGRVDDQVKIRGYRVEPGEVGRILEESGLVEQAVVLATDDKQGNKQLVGYVVCRDAFDILAIKAYLKEQLPDYMVPAHIVELTSLPLTENGKVDRKALPDPEGTITAGGYVAPENETEVLMAEIWKELLEVEDVGITDDFFELGGHSLLAVRLISAIRKAFGIELPMGDVFLYPTIAGLIERLESEYRTTSQLLIPIKATGNKVPLYIVCGIGGTVLKFVNFIKILDAEQPVYGLQQPADIKDLEDFPNTTERIAEMYLNEILKQNPNGPYALSGHCFGAKIALEIARQLGHMGKKVTLLAMFDAYTRDEQKIIPPTFDNYYHIPGIIKKTFSKISQKIEFETFLLLNHPKEDFQYRIGKLKSKLGIAGNKPEDIQMESFNKVSDLLRIASHRYEVKYYDGEVLVFYAKEHYYFGDQESGIFYKKIKISERTKNAWKKYAKAVKVYEIEGEHSTIFDSKSEEGLARILQAHLDNVHIAGNERPEQADIITHLTHT
jgi:amino acid adenylation domain-containing protein